MLSCADHCFDSVLANDVDSVINFQGQIYCYYLVRGKGPFIQHHEVMASLFVPELFIHHLLAWQHKVYQLENWSIGDWLSHHYLVDLLRQVANHLEVPVWDLTDDLHITKQLFSLLILVEGERPSALKVILKLCLVLHHSPAARSTRY